jgi:hypothetical protein
MTIEVLVKLAARDPWSFTVLDALRRKFGIRDLVGVERLKSWRLDLDLGSEEEALAVTRRILSGSALLANPNRDIWKVRGSTGVELPGILPGESVRLGSSFAVRVADREDLVGRAMLGVLRRRLGISEMRDVGFSLVWILEFERPGDGSLKKAETIAVARSWRRGLLANPHCQEASVVGLGEFLDGKADAL